MLCLELIVHMFNELLSARYAGIFESICECFNHLASVSDSLMNEMKFLESDRSGIMSTHFSFDSIGILFM